MGSEVSYAPHFRGKRCRERAMERNIPEALTLTDIQSAVTRLTYPRRILQHRLEYGFQFAGRCVDDPQDLRCRRLLVQRLLKLIEQSSVLDGDGCLFSKIGDKLDLLVG